MNPLIPIIAQYGLEFTVELVRLLNDKPVPTPEDFLALKQKYASKTADQYLSEALAKQAKP